jgi:hypothetical protein
MGLDDMPGNKGPGGSTDGSLPLQRRVTGETMRVPQARWKRVPDEWENVSTDPRGRNPVRLYAALKRRANIRRPSGTRLVLYVRAR